MPANDHEVFAHLVSGEEAQAAIDFLTYASFAFERAEWIQHATLANNGVAPDQAAINAWIANITPYQFDQMRVRAAATFDVSARQYMAADIEAVRQETLKSGVLREVNSATEVQKANLAATLTEVRSAGGFKKQLGIALLTAILAPLLIGAVIAAALVFSDRFPTYRDVAKAVAAPPAPPAATPDK